MEGIIQVQITALTKVHTEMIVQTDGYESYTSSSPAGNAQRQFRQPFFTHTSLDNPSYF